MTLNEYRDEARRFMAAIGAGREPVSKILTWLDEETAALTDAATRDDRPMLRHQVYDVLFLLFELAGRFDLDLDAEWSAGRGRKKVKYLNSRGSADGD